MSTPPFCTVALLSPPHASLTYSLPAWWPLPLRQPGARVAVPLGAGGLRAGVITATLDTLPPLPEGTRLRPLAWPLEASPLLTPEYTEMATQLALRQCLPMGHILGHVLPPGLRSTRLRLRCFADGRVVWHSLKQLQHMDDPSRRALAVALVEGAATLVPPRSDSAADERCLLNAEPPWPVRPMATRQIAVLEYLLQHGPVSRRTLLHVLGDTANAALGTLVERGHVRLHGPHEDDTPPLAGEDTALLPPPPAAFTLSPAQEEAVAAFTAALDTGTAQSRLLFGVTGSGKTAVYIQVAAACLARGKSVLLLAPEVALALKLFRDVCASMPGVPALLYHGYQGPASRERAFAAVGNGQARVVVGTRSALFLPLRSVGCIMLDEEHDASFKQDETFVYHAKEVAWFLARQHGALLLLGSATPDVKTFYAARQGRLPVHRLPERVGGGTLPAVRLVDISRQRNTEEALAPESLEAINATVARGEQVVVLLNRRGYAPLMYCLDCQRVAKCPHCAISLTYHKARQRLVCHYCGYSTPHPALCPHCKGSNYLPMGSGTEKLVESLPYLANGAAVLRLDRDSTRRPGHMESILQAFARQEAPILVGTQMLSKGHHFPNVTLAVVADADLGLNLPDYRAAERTFQLLVQSSGRAGRGLKPGQVLIQTRNTGHYCWEFVKNCDYEGFYAAELARREKRRYPPFTLLGLLRMSHTLDCPAAPAVYAAMSRHIRERCRALQLTALGPAPAPMALLRGRRRFHCLLKGQQWQAMRQLFQELLGMTDKNILRISLDLDPLNML